MDFEDQYLEETGEEAGYETEYGVNGGMFAWHYTNDYVD